MANAAIGIKFEVEGGGNISSGSGETIRRQLSQITENINKTPFQIKFGIDTNYFKKEIETLRDAVAKLEKTASGSGAEIISKKSIDTASDYTDSLKKLEEATKRYYEIKKKAQDFANKSDALTANKSGFSLSKSKDVPENEKAEAKGILSELSAAKAEMEEASKLAQVKRAESTQATKEQAAAQKEAAAAEKQAAKEQAAAQKEEEEVLQEVVAAYKEKLKAQKDLFDFTTRSKTVTQKDGTFTLTPNDNENASSIEEGILLYNKYTEAELKATEAAAELNEEQLKVFESEKKALDDKYVKASVKKIASAEKSWDGLKAKAAQYIQQNQQAFEKTEGSREKLKELQDLIKNGDYSSFDELKKKLAEAGVYLQENGLLTKSWFDQFKANFSGRVKTILSSMIIGAVTKNIKQIYTNVLEIDTAMTQLKIVTGENEAAFEDFSDTVAKSAKKIGASITDLIESTTTYARLGFSLAESEKYAELTAMYSKVANVDTNEATSNITSIIKAYDISSDELESVLDKMTWVGNSYAISSAEIGEAMNNAASSLVANGNTLEESIGIVTAANVSLQNVSKASTAVRTIAARISASKTDLEELGEDVTGVSTAKIAKQMKAFGVEIINNNGELKSTYDILADIANKWSDLNSVEKASIAGTLAGKLVPVRTVMCAIEHI